MWKSPALWKTLGALALWVIIAALVWLIWLMRFEAGYLAGRAAFAAELQQQQDALDQDADKARKENKEAEDKAVNDHAKEVEIIYIKGDTITKEIPIYVPQEPDDCRAIPLGFVRMYDAATAQASGDGADAKEAASHDGH